MPDPLLQTFRDRLHQGNDSTLAADLEAAVLGRRNHRGDHADWGLLCEEAGLLSLAFREWQLALRDDAHDATAAFRLAQHYRERGDTGRAAGLLERLLDTDPARDEWLTLYVDTLRADGAEPRARAAIDRAVHKGLPAERAAVLRRTGPPPEEPEPTADLVPTDADCVRFQGLFAGREDVHARQWARRGGDGGYSPVQEPLTPAVARNHLLGTYTVGVYPIRLDGTCTFFAVDLDVDRSAVEQAQTQPALARSLRADLRSTAARLLTELRGLGWAPLFEDSGYKGRHFWVFLEEPEPAEVLHLLGRHFLAWQSPQLTPGLHLEFFPKQGSLKGKGLGNLIKLPLGIHRRTGRRAVLLDDQGQPLADPLASLRAVRRLPRATLYQAAERLKASAPAAPPTEAAPPPERAPGPAGPLPPAPAPAWTEADFDTDPRIRHLLAHCPVLAELKRTVDQHRRLSHEEQLVLIHTLGHLEGGPLAVNYLFARCLDVGPEKLLKSQLKGNPVSCPSIRKKIGHITRRVACNCPFDFAPDRYPTPVLHLLTLPVVEPPPPPAPAVDLEGLARRYSTIAARLEEVRKEFDELRDALVTALRATPSREAHLPEGCYRLVEREGVAELVWEPPQKGTEDAKKED
jgi:hypothetical protein